MTSLLPSLYPTLRGCSRTVSGQRVRANPSPARRSTSYCAVDALELDAGTIPVVVDMNPRKQGRYVPGTAQPVVAPGVLGEYAVRTVLVMNPAYLDEIRETLADAGPVPELIAL